jgi:hypothetical protein
MQGEIIESSRIRRSMWDGPFAMSYQLQNTTSPVVLGAGAQLPYALVYNPGTTPITVTMYTPNPSNIMWCHEIINLGTGAGTITVKGASAGNPSLSPTVAAGKRAEVVWNPFAATPDWTVYVSA